MSSNGMQKYVAQLVLMVIVALGFFSLLAILVFHDVPDKNKDIVEGMLGGLGTAFTLIVGHYFRSSADPESTSMTIPTALLPPPVATPPAIAATGGPAAAADTAIPPTIQTGEVA